MRIDITLKRVREVFRGWVCSLSYPACNAHAPYYIVIRELSAFTILFHYYLINGMLFRKKSLNVKYVYGFLGNIRLKHFSLYEEFNEI